MPPLYVYDTFQRWYYSFFYLVFVFQTFWANPYFNIIIWKITRSCPPEYLLMTDCRLQPWGEHRRMAATHQRLGPGCSYTGHQPVILGHWSNYLILYWTGAGSDSALQTLAHVEKISPDIICPGSNCHSFSNDCFSRMLLIHVYRVFNNEKDSVHLLLGL